MKKVEELADKHWEFVEGLIMILIKMGKYLFKKAIIHGYKHGQKDMEKKDD